MKPFKPFTGLRPRTVLTTASLVACLALSTPAAANTACTTPAADAVRAAMDNAAREYEERMRREYEATMGQQPGPLASCLDKLNSIGLGANISLPTYAALVAAAQEALAAIIENTCLQAYSMAYNAANDAVNGVMGNGTSLPYGLGGVSGGFNDSGTVGVGQSEATPTVPGEYTQGLLNGN
jgi:hypothetical protein